MNNSFKEWIKAAGVRAIKTIAQTAVSMISIGTAMSDVDWAMVGSVSLLAGILSLLTSIAGLPELRNNEEYIGEIDDVEDEEQ